jgi:pimeloyl-ACP methyl ester carboxylesterase
MDCPVTVLWGEPDEWIPLAQGRKLAGRLGAQRFVPVPDAGHLLQEDCPQAVVAAMLAQAQ